MRASRCRSSDWEPSVFETRVSPISICRKVDARGRKYHTAEERTRFLAAARARPNPTVQTLVRTLAMTGCRVSEALGIRACAVDLAAVEHRIAALKLRKAHWRAVPVREDLVQALDLVHRIRRDCGTSPARARGARSAPSCDASASKAPSTASSSPAFGPEPPRSEIRPPPNAIQTSIPPARSNVLCGASTRRAACIPARIARLHPRPATARPG